MCLAQTRNTASFFFFAVVLRADSPRPPFACFFLLFPQHRQTDTPPFLVFSVFHSVCIAKSCVSALSLPCACHLERVSTLEASGGVGEEDSDLCGGVDETVQGAATTERERVRVRGYETLTSLLRLPSSQAYLGASCGFCFKTCAYICVHASVGAGKIGRADVIVRMRGCTNLSRDNRK